MANYVIFGAGRVGGNMAHYLEALGHDVSLISHAMAKSDGDVCRRAIAAADIVGAAVPDDHIANWRDEWADAIGNKTAIHFSGAARIAGMYAFHPLYSFPPGRVSPDVMKTIAFACPSDGADFKDVFANAPNPHFKIADEDRARYHALAVLSGNFAAYLWNETAKELAQFSGLAPETIMGGYLSSVVDRFLESPTDSLTGPVARRDMKTVEANMEALAASPKLQQLYRAFIDAAWPDYQG